MMDGGADGLPPELHDLLDGREEGEELRRIWERLAETEEAREYDVDGEWAELADELDARATADDGDAERVAGRRVEAGEVLAILESMKMEIKVISQ